MPELLARTALRVLCSHVYSVHVRHHILVALVVIVAASVRTTAAQVLATPHAHIQPPHPIAATGSPQSAGVQAFYILFSGQIDSPQWPSWLTLHKTAQYQ